MEEKYNQLEDENASDTSEKSKTGLVTPEKKVSIEAKKESDSTVPAPVPSASKTEVKEEDEQDSDHEDPHGEFCKLFKLGNINYQGILIYIYTFSKGIVEWIGRCSLSESSSI